MNKNTENVDNLNIQKYIKLFSKENFSFGDDFEESYPGEQNNYKKILSNEWGFIIKWSIDLGNNHFAITINVPKFCSVNTNDSCIIYNLHKYIKDVFVDYFPTITWFFIVNEKNENEQLHFHLLVAIRNFIDYNYVLKNNISNVLINQLEYFFGIEGFIDLKIDSLLYFKDIKNWSIYMHKDLIKWDYKASIYVITPYLCNKLNTGFTGKFLDIYEYYIKPNNSVQIIYINEIDFSKHKNILNMIWGLNGVKLTYNKIDQRTLINILQYYLILNEYYIYNENIYIKIKNSKISYKLINSIKHILYDKFQENVVMFFIKTLKYYFEGFDFSYLLDNFFIKSKNIIESIKDISTQRIQPNFGLIEFTDGVYSIKYDRFFSNNENYVFSNKISTIKYFNKSYNWVRQTKPINWINGLKNALNIKDNELVNDDYIRLCLHIINPLHKNIFNKKSTLFIYGKSNTGKTTLIANILTDFYGSDNIGSIVSAKNFKWQDLVGKVLGILDEGRYNPSMSSDLLKITGLERIIVEKKYSKDHIIINPIPLIILTNILFEDKNKLIDDALKNRLYIIEFINTISKHNLNNSNLFKKKLKNEEPNIIVYCNKLLFKLKQDNLKQFGNKIPNNKIIELISNNISK